MNMLSTSIDRRVTSTGAHGASMTLALAISRTHTVTCWRLCRPAGSAVGHRAVGKRKGSHAVFSGLGCRSSNACNRLTPYADSWTAPVCETGPIAGALAASGSRPLATAPAPAPSPLPAGRSLGARPKGAVTNEPETIPGPIHTQANLFHSAGSTSPRPLFGLDNGVHLTRRLGV